MEFITHFQQILQILDPDSQAGKALDDLVTKLLTLQETLVGAEACLAIVKTHLIVKIGKDLNDFQMKGLHRWMEPAVRMTLRWHRMNTEMEENLVKALAEVKVEDEIRRYAERPTKVPFGYKVLHVNELYYRFHKRHTVADLLDDQAKAYKAPLEDLSLCEVSSQRVGRNDLRFEHKVISLSTKLWDIAKEGQVLSVDHKKHPLPVHLPDGKVVELQASYAQTTVGQLLPQLANIMKVPSHEMWPYLYMGNELKSAQLMQPRALVYAEWMAAGQPKLWGVHFNWLVVKYEIKDGWITTKIPDTSLSCVDATIMKDVKRVLRLEGEYDWYTVNDQPLSTNDSLDFLARLGLIDPIIGPCAVLKKRT